MIGCGVIFTLLVQLRMLLLFGDAFLEGENKALENVSLTALLYLLETFSSPVKSEIDGKRFPNGFTTIHTLLVQLLLCFC